MPQTCNIREPCSSQPNALAPEPSNISLTKPPADAGIAPLGDILHSALHGCCLESIVFVLGACRCVWVRDASFIARTTQRSYLSLEKCREEAVWVFKVVNTAPPTIPLLDNLQTPSPTES